MASTVKILAGMNLLFTLASVWSTAFLIFQAVMNFAIVASGTMRRKPESISTSSFGINYEVFLSFRGADTRKKFTDHLYSGLVDARIEVFRDNENLGGGQEIHLSLIEAINRSKISIAILSRDYASSKSCLMELRQMWECKKSNGQIIIPIFYDISPSDVKHQTGDFGWSFYQHVLKGVDADTIQTWKGVLQQIAQLKGYEPENIDEGHEAKLVKKVLTRVRELLKKDDQVVAPDLVGMDFHVKEMMTKLGVVDGQEEAKKAREGDVRVIGIWGIRGVGKTTLARIVYNKMHVLFQICSFLKNIISEGEEAKKACEGDVRVVGIWGIRGVGKTTLARIVYNKMHVLFQKCSFLENINSEGVVPLQERLIASLKTGKCEASNSYSQGNKILQTLFDKMKVLIVLDDVRDVEQIKGLVGELTWFGPGSRIIVTTNRKDVLRGFDHGVVEDYKVEPMRDHHALQLFRQLAFQGDAPQDVFDSLSIDIVRAIGGLPKAIEIQASYLSKKRGDIEAWTNALGSLRRHPSEGAKTLLDIGYASLDHHGKKIFLDIACFFVGNDERIPTYMWQACDCYPPTGLDPLRNLHWLESGENNELRMDNMIRDFGRDIIKSKLVHKRCRFWNPSDALSIVENRTGTKRVEGINLVVETTFYSEQFWKMSNLRYLRLGRAEIQKDVTMKDTMKLFPNLRWLEWPYCPSISQLCDMHLKELVILDLSGSQVAGDSQIWRRIVEKAEKLKVLNLQGCCLIGEVLKFPAPIDLEILILECCDLLSEIGTFISKLEKLKSLNLKNCKVVDKLPEEQDRMKSLTELLIDGTGIKEIQIQIGCLEKLEVLSARQCGKLKDISTIGHLRNLSSLDLDGADIDGLPDTFEFHQTLKTLSLRSCDNLSELPTSIGKLKVLEVLDLSNTRIKKMPSSVEELTELKTLKMAGTLLAKFPRDIVKLAKLEEIDFSECWNLKGEVHCDISKLSSLRILTLSSSNVAGLPKSIRHLPCLQILDIRKCDQLHALPKLPSSLLCLRWESKKMTITDLSNLTNLKDLFLSDGEQPNAGWFMMLLNLMTPNLGWITRLPSLETLELSLPQVTYLPGNFSALTHLRELTLCYMEKLDLTQFPSPSLLSLRLKRCKIRKPKISGLIYLSELELEECDLAEIDGLEDLKLLEVLKIDRCRSVTNLNGLKDLTRLRKVGGDFSARPSLPKFSHPVDLAICTRDPSE